MTNGVPVIAYFMERKHFPHKASNVLIPSGLLRTCLEEVKVVNDGEGKIRWKKGRLIARVEACQPSDDVTRASESKVKKLSLSNISGLDISGLKRYISEM